MLFAALGGLLFSFFTVTLRCNHNVTGLTLTTFGVGLSSYFIGLIKNDSISKAGLAMQSMVKFDWGDNWFGSIFLSQSFLTYFAIVVAIAASLIISRTKLGLNLRACGENPAAADAAGINVDRYRYLATIIGAAIAGLGGMALELDLLRASITPKMLLIHLVGYVYHLLSSLCGNQVFVLVLHSSLVQRNNSNITWSYQVLNNKSSHSFHMCLQS